MSLLPGWFHDYLRGLIVAYNPVGTKGGGISALSHLGIMGVLVFLLTQVQ